MLRDFCVRLFVAFGIKGVFMNLRCSITIIVIFVLTGCATNLEFPQRALIEPKQIKSAISVEKELNGREEEPIPEGGKWFEVIEGTIPVIVTAPHSTRPLRNRKRRFSDGGGTAALAISLGELTGVYVIYTTYEGPSDPNYYHDNKFKEELSDLINKVKPAYILDIHGSHPYRSYDIDLGTMGGESLLGNEDLLFDLIKHLNKEGIESISYNRFGASKNETITKFSYEHGVPAIQMEINATYVTPSNGNIEAQRFSKLLQALTRFIRSR